MDKLLPESLRHASQDYVFQLTNRDFDGLWEEISRKDPEEIGRNALAALIGPGLYVLEMMGADYLFDLQGRSVTGPLNRMRPDKRVLLSLAYYLNGATPTTMSANLVPETVLPGGDRFFAGTHALKREPILKRFGKAGPEFLEAARKMGADILPAGSPDSFGFVIKLLPKIVVQVILGEEDEEFPAQLNFAFDDSAASHISLGALASLVSILNDQLVLLANPSATA